MVPRAAYPSSLMWTMEHLPCLTFKYNQILVYQPLELCSLMQSNAIKEIYQFPSQYASVHNKSEVHSFITERDENLLLLSFLNSPHVWAVALR